VELTDYVLGVWDDKLYRTLGSGIWENIATDCSLVTGQLHQIVKSYHAGEPAIVAASCSKATSLSEGINGHTKLVVFRNNTADSTNVSYAPHCICSFQGRIFGGEVEQIRWSNVADLATFGANDSLLVEPGVGGRLTALVPARDSKPMLWVFKEKAIFMFEVRWGTPGTGGLIPSGADALDTVNSSIRPLSVGTGCVATKSAIWVPGEEGADLFFLSDDGIRTLSRAENDVQQGASFPLSYDIPTWIARINWTYADLASAATFDNAYHLAVPFDGAKENTHVLRYDLRTKAWSLWELPMRDLTVGNLGSSAKLWGVPPFATVDTSVTGAVTAAEDTPHQVYRLLTGTYDPSTDATNPVVPQFQEESKAFALKDPLVKKKFDRFTMQLSSADTSFVAVEYRIDQGAWASITETFIPGSSDTVTLGVDPLPWTGTSERIRRYTWNLSDYDPGYIIQFRISSVAGATEVGKPTIYMQELSGKQLTRDYVNDD